MIATQAQLLCDVPSAPPAGAAASSSAPPESAGGPSFSDTLRQVRAESAGQPEAPPPAREAPAQPARPERPADQTSQRTEPQQSAAQTPTPSDTAPAEAPAQNRQPKSSNEGSETARESKERSAETPGRTRRGETPAREATTQAADRRASAADAPAAQAAEPAAEGARGAGDVQRSRPAAPATAAPQTAGQGAPLLTATPEAGPKAKQARAMPLGEVHSRATELPPAAARDSGTVAQRAREAKGQQPAPPTARPRKLETAPRPVPFAKAASTPAVSADATKSPTLVQVAAVPVQRPTAPAAETSKQERPDAREAAGPAGREAQSATSFQHRAAGQATQARRSRAQGTSDAAASRPVAAAEAPAIRGKDTTTLPDAPPQAAQAAWRHYAVQPTQTAQPAAAGAVPQAFQTAQREVVQQARMVGGNGRSEVTVRLNPPDLGRMKVEVEMQSGKVDVKIRVENPEVREALRVELQTLDRALRGAQVEPTRLEISDYPAGPQGGWGGAAQGRSGDAPPGAGYGAVESEDDSATPSGWTVFNETGGIDCLV